MMFPHYMTLDEVSKIVREHNETLGMTVFIEADRDDHVVFNYILNFEGVFPDFTGDPVEDRRIGILRECRGLIFDKDTGLVIARRFHKFWNLNQRPEVQINMIDFNAPHIIMDKLDGSMITPFKTSRSARRWGTKMGDTEVAIPVQAHVAARPEYDDLAYAMEAMGVTPIFEWCSRQQRIVIDYPEDQLVLTHLRHNSTGAYETRAVVSRVAEQFGIPTVKVIEGSINDIDEFIEHTRALKNLEGYVVHFDNDLMLKLKAEEYCMLHNSKEQLNFEKNVVAMIFAEGVDDLLPQLDEGDRAAVTSFLDDAMQGVAKTAHDIRAFADSLIEQIDSSVDEREFRKRYAALVNGCDDLPEPKAFAKRMLFRALDVSDLIPVVINAVKENTGSATKIDLIRPLIGGIKWHDYRGYVDTDA